MLNAYRRIRSKEKTPLFFSYEIIRSQFELDRALTGMGVVVGGRRMIVRLRDCN